ncbi:hypothetical protein DFJ77DRAFT_309848 [Powellomyces hirtus]|nr:hypothetical protein DFJ77DRAFT_309848 [Powellomyces hirtus]
MRDPVQTTEATIVMSTPTNVFNATLKTIPAEILFQVALRVHSLDDLLSLVQSSQRFRALLWTPSFRHTWYTTHFSENGKVESLKPDYSDYEATLADLISWKEAAGEQYRAAAALEQVPQDLPTFFARTLPFVEYSESELEYKMLEHALPWAVRVHIVTSVTPVGSIKDDFNGCSSQYDSIKELCSRLFDFKSQMHWAERFCDIAFKGALDQRRSFRGAQSLEVADFDEESNDFMELQREIQDTIIDRYHTVNGKSVKDTVTFYDT